MEEKFYYLATVIIKSTDDNGKVKKITEKYLVHAVNYTDAESKIYKYFEGNTFEFSIKSIVDSKIVDIIEK
jgi:hypothetical protein